MATKAARDRGIFWSQVRGRDGYDPPNVVPDAMATEALNISILRGQLGRKRHGSSEQSIDGNDSTFFSYQKLARFVPGQDPTAAELHFISEDSPPKIARVAGGTTESILTLKDAIASLPQNAAYAVLNGKLFWAYDSTVNRLHVYDPGLSTSVVRRVGLDTPGAPSVADTGSGSYPDVARFYRAQWLVVDSGRVQRQSLLGTAQSFTPSGSGTHARVTQPTPPSEGETHWIVWGSFDGAAYFQVSGQIAIGTTTYDDDTDPADYSANTAAPLEGAYTPPPSAKYLLSDGNRLLMFGAYETAAGSSLPPRNGRVWITPVIDTTNTDDDERVQNTTTFKGWIDIARDANTVDRGLVGPLDGQIFVMQSRGVTMLIPTGNAESPYRRVTLSNEYGSVDHDAHFVGEDEVGRPCIYFLDPGRGLMRYGAGGFQWCGYDSQDIWARVNLNAATKVAHGLFDPEDKTVMMWVAVDSSDTPNEIIAFHVREGRQNGDEGVRFGHARWTGLAAEAACSVLFSETFGASMSSKLKPYVPAGGDGVSTPHDLLKMKDATVTDDNGTTFQAYIESKAFDLQPPIVKKRLGKSWLFGETESGATSIRQTLIRNFGQEQRTATVDMVQGASETRKMMRFEDADLADAWTFQVRLGDAAASAAAWTLDQWAATVEITEEEWGNNQNPS